MGARGQPLDRRRHLPLLREDAVDQRMELSFTQPRSLDHSAHLLRPVTLLDRPGHVIVKAQTIDEANIEPGCDRWLGVDVEGFVAQMQARIDGQMGTQADERIDDGADRRLASLSTFPGPGNRMESGGDSIRHELPVSFD